MDRDSTNPPDTTAQDDVGSGEVTKHKNSATQSKKQTSKPRPVGSARGVETMYRNAYRAELEIIALAATKANIMISLNGFITSALLISGAFIYASSPESLVPATVFLFTSAASIYFALLAASPNVENFPGGILAWLKALFKRRASLKDFSRYVRPQREFVEG